MKFLDAFSALAGASGVAYNLSQQTQVSVPSRLRPASGMRRPFRAEGVQGLRFVLCLRNEGLTQRENEMEFIDTQSARLPARREPEEEA